MLGCGLLGYLPAYVSLYTTSRSTQIVVYDDAYCQSAQLTPAGGYLQQVQDGQVYCSPSWKASTSEIYDMFCFRRLFRL